MMFTVDDAIKHQLPRDEYLARKRAGTLTKENRMAQFGDPRHDATGRKSAEEEYQAMLVQRLDDGLPLSISARREAKRLKKAMGV